MRFAEPLPISSRPKNSKERLKKIVTGDHRALVDKESGVHEEEGMSYGQKLVTA
jgi:hypothetical protein